METRITDLEHAFRRIDAATQLTEEMREVLKFALAAHGQLGYAGDALVKALVRTL